MELLCPASVWACPIESLSCLGQEGMGHYPWWVWPRINTEPRPWARPPEEHLYCELFLVLARWLLLIGELVGFRIITEWDLRA